MVLHGDVLVEGAGEGTAMVCDVPLAFGLVDPQTGIVRQPGHPWEGKSVAGKVLVFPTGTGSTSGSYWLLNLASAGNAPAAIVNEQADAVIVAGAVLANVPLVHRVRPAARASIRPGDRVRVGEDGRIEVAPA